MGRDKTHYVPPTSKSGGLVPCPPYDRRPCRHLPVAELVVLALFDGGRVDERRVEYDGVDEHEGRDDGVEQREVVEHLQACQLLQRPVDRQAGMQLEQAPVQIVPQQPDATRTHRAFGTVEVRVKRGFQPTQRTQRKERDEMTSLLDRPITAASDDGVCRWMLPSCGRHARNY